MQAINGVGPTIAAIIVAEIGDVTRFPTARHLCSWAGLTPGHRESDVKGHDTGITKQGSKLLRWALIEGISRYHGGPHLAGEFRRIAERRGKNKARVADRPQGAHLGLLRAARRRDPLPHPTGGGMRFGSDTTTVASSTIGMTPTPSGCGSAN